VGPAQAGCYPRVETEVAALAGCPQVHPLAEGNGEGLVVGEECVRCLPSSINQNSQMPATQENNS